MTGWDVSNATVHHRDAARTIQATRGPIMQKTKAHAERILNEKGYCNPEALSAGISEQTRQKKIDEKDLNDAMIK